MRLSFPTRYFRNGPKITFAILQLCCSPMEFVLSLNLSCSIRFDRVQQEQSLTGQ